jgi:nucleobase:cation symporter-1, NCS1 family
MAQTTDEMVREEVVKSRLPTLPSERILGLGDMVLIQISFSVATWMLVMGAWTGMATPLPLAIIAALFGCSVPLLFHSFIGPFCARWGCDHGILTRAVAGPLGTKILMICVAMFCYIGWTSIPVVMFGRTMNEAMGWANVTGTIANPEMWSFVALGLSSLILWKWTSALKFFFRVVTPLIVVLLILMTYKIISHYGLSHIASIKPEGFHADPWISFMIAVEMNVGLGFSWVFCYAIYCRQAKTESVAYYGPWLGWGPIWALACIPAICGGLVAGVSDPVYLLKDIGGYWVVLYMIFLGVANIFSAVCTMYIVSLTARVLWPKLKWGQAVSINWLVGLLILIPAAYDYYGTFVAFVGAVLGPIGTVFVVDIFMRRFSVNMEEIYDDSSNSAYYYWKGINPYVFIAMGLGTFISLWIYNPVAAAPHVMGIFKFAGAAIPASLSAGVIYFILAKTFLVPNKIGFPKTKTAVESTVVNK